MGYVLRVRLASFFAGAAVASFSGVYLLQQDHKVFHHSLSQQLHYAIITYQQMKEINDSLDGRISALENLKGNKISQHSEATE